MQLVYLSPVPWSSIAQRPHFFIKTALEHGFNSILWVEPTPSRLPQLKDLKATFLSQEPNSFEIPDGVKLLGLNVVPIEPFGYLYDRVNSVAIANALKKVSEFSEAEETVLVIGKPSRFALNVIECVHFSRKLFDVMDDFPMFYQGISAKSMGSVFRTLLRKVDFCLFSSKNLQYKYANLVKRHKLVLNACDKDFAYKCALVSVRTKTEKKIFGYIGSVADWFDWESVIKLANDYPKDSIVIIGPVYTNKIPKLPKNIEMKQAISHDLLPEVLASFDYGLIPFLKTDLTNSVDPVKYYEYVAAGVPVISTSFGEMSYRIDLGFVQSFNDFNKKNVTKPHAVVTWDQRFANIEML